MLCRLSANQPAMSRYPLTIPAPRPPPPRPHANECTAIKPFASDSAHDAPHKYRRAASAHTIPRCMYGLYIFVGYVYIAGCRWSGGALRLWERTNETPNERTSSSQRKRALLCSPLSLAFTLCMRWQCWGSV